MSTDKDPRRFLAAAYSFVPEEREWLAGVTETLRPYDLGGGIAVYTSELGAQPRVRTHINETPLPGEAIEAMAKHLPPAYYRRLHAPMPLVSSDPFFVDSAREVGLSHDAILQMFGRPTPPAAWALCGGDRDLETALVVFHCQPDAKPSARDKRVLDCFAAHLGSALRLRSLLHGAAPSAEDTHVDLVLAPDGRVLDARGDAKEEAVRGSLIDAVRLSERAKTRAASEDERLEVWTALLDGRWSILEQEERDGKRTLLAYRNDPRTSPLRVLDERERAVVAYAALGHSFKYIGYELGVAVSTVSDALDQALAKLGLSSRTELIALFAHGHGDAGER